LAAALVIAVAGLAGVPAGAEDPEMPILDNDEALVSVVLHAAAFCPDPPAHLPAVGFRLEPAEFESPIDPQTLEILASKEIRLDLTVFRGGFKRGDFESYELEPFGEGAPPTSSSDPEDFATVVTVGNLRPGVVHFARALVLVGEGWVPTEVTRFTTPICAVDGLDEEEVAP
jgi:hypothetical protein